jgi:hypothetical protein
MNINKAICDSFIDGYNKGKEDMFNKACEWLNNELFEDKVFINPYYDTDVKSKSYDTLDQFMENFKKAMEL